MSKTTGSNRYVVNDAYIGWLKFELPPESAPTVKEAVEKLDEILRFILIKAPKESVFTFAKAKAAIAEKEALELLPKEGPETETVIE